MLWGYPPVRHFLQNNDENPGFSPHCFVLLPFLPPDTVLTGRIAAGETAEPAFSSGRAPPVRKPAEPRPRAKMRLSHYGKPRARRWTHAARRPPPGRTGGRRRVYSLIRYSRTISSSTAFPQLARSEPFSFQA